MLRHDRQVIRRRTRFLVTCSASTNPESQHSEHTAFLTIAHDIKKVFWRKLLATRETGTYKCPSEHRIMHVIPAATACQMVECQNLKYLSYSFKYDCAS